MGVIRKHDAAFLLITNAICNRLRKWSAGLKVMNFQARTWPIRLFNISNFPSSRL